MSKNRILLLISFIFCFVFRMICFLFFVVVVNIFSSFFLSFFFSRRRSGTSHNTGYKPRQKSNRLGSSTGIEGKKMEQRIRKMLGCF